MVSLRQKINGLKLDLDLKRQEFDESERNLHEQLVTSDRDLEIGRKEAIDLKKELETKRCKNEDLSEKLQSKTDSLSQSDCKLRAHLLNCYQHENSVRMCQSCLMRPQIQHQQNHHISGRKCKKNLGSTTKCFNMSTPLALNEQSGLR